MQNCGEWQWHSRNILTMHIPSSGRPPVVYSKFTHSQQSLASLYTKMNPNLWLKPLFKEEK